MGSAAGVLTWVLVVGVGAACWHLGKAKARYDAYLHEMRELQRRIQRSSSDDR